MHRRGPTRVCSERQQLLRDVRVASSVAGYARALPPSVLALLRRTRRQHYTATWEREREVSE
jgi:hypothetical protein